MKLDKYASVGIGIGIALSAAFLILNLAPKPALDVEVMKGQTPHAVGAIEFLRIKITNNSGQPLTDVVVDMGPDDVQRISRIGPGEWVLVSPKSVNISKVTITTSEGITVTKDIGAAVVGLP